MRILAGKMVDLVVSEDVIIVVMTVVEMTNEDKVLALEKEAVLEVLRTDEKHTLRI